MVRAIIFFGIVCAILACEKTDNSQQSIDSVKVQSNDTSQTAVSLKKEDDWIFDRIDHDRLHFKNGRFVETDLEELEYIGQIPVANKEPYVIFAGSLGEDFGLSIFMHSTADSKFMVSSSGKNGFPYPEILLEHDADSNIYVSYSVKSFYGYIMEKTEGFVWYEEKMAPNEEIVSTTVHLSKLVNGSLQDTVFEDNTNAKLNETLLFSQRGLCKEIKSKGVLESPCAH